MAINSFEIQCNQIPPKSLCSLSSSNGDDLLPCRLVKINFTNDGSVTSATSKRSKSKRNGDQKSPYLIGDKVHLLSRITEKRIVQKKSTDYVSSFPLAANIYKANSDEFKSLKQGNKKVRKSVLTLPNEPTINPQTCTVSDMNDSEYFNQEDGNRKTRSKKRFAIQNNKRPRRKSDFEYFDRDARYCSQMNINLDCSSTDIFKNYNGDSKSKTRTKKSVKNQIPQTDGNYYGHNVWAVLRNMNRFQFRPSPPMSEDSIVTMKKKKVFKSRKNQKDSRFVGTCRTEEFAYISSIEVDSKSRTSFSQTSSFDRITVIDNEDEFNEVCKQFGENITKTCNLVKSTNAITNRNQTRNKNRTQRQRSPKMLIKAIEPNTNIKLMPKEYETKRMYGMLGKNSKDCANSNDNNESLLLNVELDKPRNQKAGTHVNKDLKTVDNENFNNDKISNQSNHLDNFNDTFINLRNSNSSKGPDNTVKSNQDNQKIKNGMSDKQLKSPTNVVLSKRHEARDTVQLNKRLESQNRKPRLVTTMPTTMIIPKSTQTDIKRRLANIKFPLVILGKDQLSSTFEAIDCNPPQFAGLDERIWPFMLDWNDENRPKGADNVMKLNHKLGESNAKRIKCNTIPVQPNINGLRKSYYNISANKEIDGREKKTLHIIDSLNKNKAECNKSKLPAENSKHQKQKPIRLLKDKMLRFLYKKSPVSSVTEESHQITGQGDVQECMNPFNTVVKDDINIPEHNIITQNSREPTKRLHWSPPNSPKSRSLTATHPWSKAKWASEFIDNVIKKIKNGVYYNQYNKNMTTECVINSKEASIQTALTTKNASNIAVTEICNNIIPVRKNNALQAILGFDTTLPELEIKTLNKHQIEIKHCVANVMVRFDVGIPTQPDKVVMNVKESLSLLPLNVTESETKVFKCKNIILNAMLPAELCSLLPEMLGKITEPGSKLSSSLLPISKTESHLSTISELSHFENHEPIKMLPQLQNDKLPGIRSILQGMFMPVVDLQRIPFAYKATLRFYGTFNSIAELLPKLSANPLISFKMNPLEFKVFGTTPITNQQSTKKNQIVFKTCTALQPYKAPRRQLMPSLERLNFTGMFENMWNYYKMNAKICSSTRFLEIKLGSNANGNSFTMNISLKDDWGQKNDIAITNNKLNVDSLYEGYTKNNESEILNYSTKRCVPFIKSSSVTKLETKDSQIHVSASINKPKRKCFMKLYKKCKSTTNISREKSCTCLTKITTLDDFFELLGSNKSLSCVFDGYSAEKLLSSIIEMKNWITELSSRQALLVLLLINKKDTPNLVRFRPILLQGIAVNRITRATELDMEIEVIEREHFYKLSQLDDVPHMRASIENHGNLLEELYWIAKTTASDYQRPFDESSEKLLKSLLEKRQKLNPSYLRVMARYVGLGLLKLPRKN